MEFVDPQLPSIKHFRDVGKSINHIAKRQLLKEGVLFVSSSISDASASENEYLRNTLKVRTVIDTAWETTRTRTPASEQLDPKQPLSWINITRCLGLTYCGVKWRRGPYVDQLMSELSIWQQTKFFGNAMLEDQARAITVVTDVARGGGATKESLRVLGASKIMVGELCNKVFGEDASYPILMIGNRDSGIFNIVLLLFLGVPVDIISQEIVLSIPHYQASAKIPPDEPSIRFIADFVENAGTWAEDVKRWLEEKYGGIEGYFTAAAISTKAQDAVKEALLANAGEKLVEF